MKNFDASGCLISILLVLSGFVIAFLFSLLFAWPVMLLWNWLMPVVFGLTTINFWQAFGIMVLCSLLFKSTNVSQTSK